MGIYENQQRAISRQKSTAERKDVQLARAEVGPSGVSCPKPPAGTQALPVDTLPKPKMGRPRTGYIKAEYNRAYSADLRTIKRLGLSVTVAEWRKQNANEIPV